MLHLDQKSSSDSAEPMKKAAIISSSHQIPIKIYQKTSLKVATIDEADQEDSSSLMAQFDTESFCSESEVNLGCEDLLKVDCYFPCLKDTVESTDNDSYQSDGE